MLFVLASRIRGRRLPRDHEVVSSFFSAYEISGLCCYFDEPCFGGDSEGVALEVETGVVCIEGTGEGDGLVFFKLVILERVGFNNIVIGKGP